VSFQVLVKTTAVMNGAYTFLLPDREAAQELVQRPDVWWYHYPAEDDDWRWHRGGAWKPAHEMTDDEYRALDTVKPLPPRGPQQAMAVVEDDDDRW